MRLLLVAGGYGAVARRLLEKPSVFVNDAELNLGEAAAYIQQASPDVNALLVTDDALSVSSAQDRRDMEALLQLTAGFAAPVSVLVLTRDSWKGKEWEGLTARFPQLRIVLCEYIRISPAQLNAAVRGADVHPHPAARPANRGVSLPENPARPASHAPPHTGGSERETREPKKSSFLDRFRSKPKERQAPEPTDPLTREMNRISRGISRVVAVTGHRGSGMTSTAVNVASEAGRRGLSALIVDLDIDYRSTNMYFSSFHERTKRDEEINASLIRTLARPQDYASTAFSLKENVWLTALGYGFEDRKLIGQFVNEGKLIGLLSLLRNRFNLIILDIPLDLLRDYPEMMIHIDCFGLCVPNDLYSVVSTLRNVENSLDRERAAYLNAKSKLIVTKYNDRSRFQGEVFTPDAVSRVLTSGLLDSFTYEMKVAGPVAYSSDFDSQIESDVPLVYTSANYERAYGNILLRLLEGTG